MAQRALICILIFSRALAAPISSSYIPKSTFSRLPALLHTFADPAITTDAQGQFWAFATDDIPSGGAGFNVQMANSSDFENWSYQNADALPVAGNWTADPPHIWAPDVVRLDDNSYVLYYAATPSSNPTVHCVGAATATTISGPYSPLPTPLHCPASEGGAIDPSGFRDPATGKHYLMFKVDGNNGQPGGMCGNVNPSPRATPIRMQEVSSDGVSPVGSIVQILDRDESDGPLVEAPSMMSVPNKDSAGGYAYVLFFSSHCFRTANYNVRYAISTNGILNNAALESNTTGVPQANYVKHPQPLLSSTNADLVGPGGLDVHPDGKHVVFHAAQIASEAGTRRMHLGLIQMAGLAVNI